MLLGWSLFLVFSVDRIKVGGDICIYVYHIYIVIYSFFKNLMIQHRKPSMVVNRGYIVCLALSIIISYL